MRGLIISSGNLEDYKFLKKLAINSDFIICADGGLRHSISIDIVPNAVIGDLDSIGYKSMEFIVTHNIPVIKYPVEKDETDTELALIYLFDLGCNEITLTGVTGSRMDHTLANIYLLRKLVIMGVQGKIVDSNNTIYMVRDYIKLARRKDYYISIIPITKEGVVVTLKGFYYPLNSSFIHFGSTLGISNKIVDEYGEIKIDKGEALVIESKD